MNSLRRLVHEIHRRSLWQVLGIYVLGSWGVLQAVEVLTGTAGLPDWTPGFAFVLLLIGLPICVATAFVQEGAPGGIPSTRAPEPGEYDLGPSKPARPNLAEGTGSLDRPSTRPRFIKRFLTWKKALWGGAAAFALLAVSVVAYFVMWSTGIGPVGSLVAQGVFEDGESVVLADFENTSDDPSLGSLVTETLRIDLANSPQIHVIDPARVSEALRRMEQPEDVRLTPELAREVAQREGVKAVIEGSVGTAGDGYLLLATVRAAQDGRALASLRRTARSQSEVIDAIDGLSQDIREKAGESLRSIKGEEPLEAVTTSSMEALQLFVEAEEYSERGDSERAVTLLREAVAIDPEFGMAYRKLASDLFNAGRPFSEIVEAAERAYALRDRLTERERALSEAQYHNRVTRDADAEIRAYEAVLARFPDDATALNNLAIVYAERSRYAEALELVERAVAGPGESSSAYVNRVGYRLNVCDTAGAREALREVEERRTDGSGWPPLLRSVVAWTTGDMETAHTQGRNLSEDPDLGPAWFWIGSLVRSFTDAIQGRFEEGARHSDALLADLRDSEIPDFHLNAQLDRARFELVRGQRSEALSVLRAGLEGRFDELPPESRDYEDWAVALAWAGDPGAARALMEQATAEQPPQREAALREARRRVEAIATGVEGDPAEGLRALDRLRRSAGCAACWPTDAALLAESAGDLARAAVEYERIVGFRSFGAMREFGTAMAVVRLGPIYEELGETEQAAAAYDRLVRWWERADPDRQSVVEEARERLRALGREAGSEP